MNEAMLTQLKIIVERAVRPVRAASSRKRKMREELLAHAMAVYEEEAARGDERAALAATARRFGESAELTAQLQQAVPWLERFVCHVNSSRDRLWQRPGESRLRCAMRQSWHVGLSLLVPTLIPACLLFLATYAMIGDIRKPDLREIGLGIAGVALALGYFVAIVGAAVFLAHGMWHALYEAPRSWWRIVPLTVVAMLTGASFPCFIAVVDSLGAGMMALSGAHPAATLRPDFLSSLVGCMVIGPYALIFGVNLRWRILSETNGRPRSQTLLINLLAGLLLATTAFVPALVLSGDVETGIDAATGPLLLMAFWLLPCDLILSAPSIVGRLRDEREWANLVIDAKKGATA